MEPKTHDTDYLFLTTRVRSLECNLLDQDRMEQILEASNIEDAARILTECGYPELDTVTPDAVGQMLTQEQQAVWEDVGQFLPDPAVLDVFQLKYDYHNVKVLLKAGATGTEPSRLLMEAGRVSLKDLTNAVETNDWHNLPPLLAEAIEQARQVLSTTRDPQLGDFTLDQFYFRDMMELAEDAGSDFLMGYVRRTIDTANLRTAVRVLRMGKGGEFLDSILFEGGTVESDRLLQAVNAGLPLEELYASTPLQEAAAAGSAATRGGSLTQFEKLCDDTVIQYVRDARYVSFGEAPVIAYLAAKEAEMTAIRILLTGRLANLPLNVIRERLREVYV